MNPLEAIAVAFGLANIVLLIRRSVWNFPAAIVMVSLYAVIFSGAKLYAEAGLQVFFAAVNVYGWILWTRAGGREEPVAVGWLAPRQRVMVMAGIAAGTLAIGTISDRLTDAAMPYPDSFVASASVAAQILLSWRRIENWLLWVLVDIVGIILYLLRDLPLTAGLYGAFLALSVLGFREWRRVGNG